MLVYLLLFLYHRFYVLLTFSQLLVLLDSLVFLVLQVDLSLPQSRFFFLFFFTELVLLVLLIFESLFMDFPLVLLVLLRASQCLQTLCPGIALNLLDSLLLLLNDTLESLTISREPLYLRLSLLAILPLLPYHFLFGVYLVEQSTFLLKCFLELLLVVALLVRQLLLQRLYLQQIILLLLLKHFLLAFVPFPVDVLDLFGLLFFFAFEVQ